MRNCSGFQRGAGTRLVGTGFSCETAQGSSAALEPAFRRTSLFVRQKSGSGGPVWSPVQGGDREEFVRLILRVRIICGARGRALSKHPFFSERDRSLKQLYYCIRMYDLCKAPSISHIISLNIANISAKTRTSHTLITYSCLVSPYQMRGQYRM